MDARQSLISRLTRVMPRLRAWNIALRTAHIGVTGVLFGGHMFEVPAQRLLVWLYLTLCSGAMLVVLEACSHPGWWHQGRSVMVLAKLLLVGLVPWLWSYRVALLTGVIVLASVGSHMPRRLRYYSWLYRRVMEASSLQAAGDRIAKQ